MPTPNPNAAAIAAFPLADMNAPPGKRIVGLAQNESPFPPSAAAIEAGRAALTDPAGYPDPGWRALRQAIAETHAVPADLILCSAGSMDVIAATIQAFSEPGTTVLSTAHGYGYFRTAALSVGADYVAVDEPEMTVSVDLLLERTDAATRVVAIANPGNPTGTRIPRAEIVRLRAGLPKDALLLIDEAYAEFTDPLGEPLFDLVLQRDDTVITRSFSKAYALAGQRIGWGLYPPGIRDEAVKLVTPGGVTRVSQAMAEAAVRDRAHLAWLIGETMAIRERFTAGLRRIGFDPVPSHTNFVLVPFADAEAAEGARRALWSEGIIVRPMGAYALPHCLRITIGRAEDMERVVELLDCWQRGA